MSGEDFQDIAHETGQKRAWREIAVDLLTAYSIPITLAIALVLVWFVNWQFDIPAYLIQGLHWALIGGLIAFFPSRWVVRWLQGIDINLILELNLAPEGEKLGSERFRLWNLGDDMYKEMTWERKPYSLGALDVVVDYDKERNHAQGVWLSDLSEIEILRFKGKLREARTKLVELAAEGIVADIETTSRTMEAVETEIQTFIKVLLDKSTLSRDEVADILLDAVDADEDLSQEVEGTTAEGTEAKSPLERAQELAADTDPSAGEGDG